MMSLTNRLVYGLGITCLLMLVHCKDKDKDAGGTSTGTTTAAASAGSVAVKVDEKGFTPSSVTFKKGAANAALVFTRTSDDTCATEVVFPDLNIKKDLPKGQAVTINIPTDKEQKLTFQCGMGMYKSAVVVN